MTVFRPYLAPFQTAKPAQRLELIELVHAFARATPARRREALALLTR